MSKPSLITIKFLVGSKKIASKCNLIPNLKAFKNLTCEQFTAHHLLHIKKHEVYTTYFGLITVEYNFRAPYYCILYSYMCCITVKWTGVIGTNFGLYSKGNTTKLTLKKKIFSHNFCSQFPSSSPPLQFIKQSSLIYVPPLQPSPSPFN